ncbi:hypothetical protein, partial [Sphaerisporangium fuscum]|uniref:hypothetical protein n=1 Tax=Sphaerisporangium fuscum TaxID=2835868 RepID=UPI001BDD0074
MSNPLDPRDARTPDRSDENPADHAEAAQDTTGGEGAEVVHLDTVRAGRHPYPPTEQAAVPPTDGTVLEGNFVRVDQPGGERRDWLTDLEEKARTRRPIVPLWLRSRTEAIHTLR